MCLCNTAFYGFQEASCALIGNSIGDKDAVMAKRYFKMSIMIMMSIGIMICTILKVFRDFIFSLFETDGLSSRLNENWNLIILSLFIDIANICFGGAVRGIGQQGFSSINYFITYFVINLPLSIYLTFEVGSHMEDGESVQGMGIAGIWTAVSCSGSYLIVVQLILLFVVSDWEELAEQSYERIQHDKQNEENEEKK